MFRTDDQRKWIWNISNVNEDQTGQGRKTTRQWSKNRETAEGLNKSRNKQTTYGTPLTTFDEGYGT